MLKKYYLEWVQIQTGRNSENRRYIQAMRKVQTTKARIRIDAACSIIILQNKNEHSHPQDEQATERQHIRSRAKRKVAEDTCVRQSKIIRSEIQAVGEEALQPHDLKGN